MSDSPGQTIDDLGLVTTIVTAHHWVSKRKLMVRLSEVGVPQSCRNEHNHEAAPTDTATLEVG